MSTTAPSKYAENQFLSATVGSFSLMNEILADTVDRATAVTRGNPAFASALAQLNAATTAWRIGHSAIANAEAALPSTTYAFEDKLAGLTRIPDADTPSLLEDWDNLIRSQVAYRGTIYRTLLPRGRRTITHGTLEERLDALHAFGTSLSLQATKPALVALGATVTTFSDAARALRNAQITAKAALELAYVEQEPLRIAAARALYALIGQGMATWNDNPSRVDTLWDVNILRSATRQIPAPPAASTWDPATRTLSTTALPPHATRLEAWRTAPGGMPELLLTAARGVTSITLPASLIFHPGSHYQLWLTATNARGRSTPGPVQSWTAE